MMIAFRMLNNLKAYNLRLQNWRGMLAMSDYQLALARENPICWVWCTLSGRVRRLGESDAALEASPAVLKCVRVVRWSRKPRLGCKRCWQSAMGRC